MDVGDLVPDFSLLDQDGKERSLVDLLKDGPIALYFYPAAMTAGCTAESCSFRDHAVDFAAVGAQRVGISKDSVERQKEFADRNHLDFPLLSDPDGIVAKIFGTRRNISFLATRRWTFVIDTDRRRVLDIVKSEVRMGRHAEQAITVLRDRMT